MILKLPKPFLTEDVEIEQIDEYFRSWTLFGLAALTALVTTSLVLFSASLPINELHFWILAIAMMISLLSITCLVGTTSTTLASIFFTGGMAAVLMAFSYLDSGMFSSSIVWYPIYPLFAVLFVGIRFGVSLGVVLLLNLVYLFQFHTPAYYTAATLPTDEALLMKFLSTSTAAVFLTLLGVAYVLWQKSIQNSVQQSNEAKSEFLSGMSHELRTPLNSIMGFADVLSHGYVGKLSDKQSEYIDNISTSSGHMLALVNDLLDISKIESGKAEFSPSPVAIDEVMTSCLKMFQKEAVQQNITIDFAMCDELIGKYALLDELKFKQILLNLLGNALKFSHENGKVTFAGDFKDDRIEISVEDNGQGIPNEFQDRVFDRFFQVNQASDNKSPGTGLGLPISRHFAELHDGTVYLDKAGLRSTTRFVVDLPFRPVESPEVDTEAPAVDDEMLRDAS